MEPSQQQEETSNLMCLYRYIFSWN